MNSNTWLSRTRGVQLVCYTWCQIGKCSQQVMVDHRLGLRSRLPVEGRRSRRGYEKLLKWCRRLQATIFHRRNRLSKVTSDYGLVDFILVELDACTGCCYRSLEVDANTAETSQPVECYFGVIDAE